VRRAVGLAAVLVAGCVRAPPADLSREPGVLLEEVRAAQARVGSVQGTARVAVESPGRSGSFEAWLAAEKPGRIRIEVLDFFGNPAAVLVARDGRFSLYDARNAVFYRGEATPENLARLLPLPLPAPDLATLLCGSAPILEGRPAAVEPDGETLRLELEGPKGREVLSIGPSATVRSAIYYPRAGEEKLARRVTFSSFRRRDGLLVPESADLRGATTRVSLRWKEQEVNPPPAGGAPYSLEPPKGARVVDLAGAEPPPVEIPMGPAESDALGR